MDAHIEHCARCRSVLETYDDSTDPFVDRLRVYACETDPEDDGQLQQLISSAERICGAPHAAPVEPAMPFRLEQYELLEKLGQGGMGVVYKAWHKKLQRHVAIKFLTPHRSQHPQAIARFHREMAAVGRLHHPNIVQAHDAGEVDGRPYLVMELVDGMDTRRLLDRYGSLPVVAACEIIRQTAEGLQYAHDAGLLHRDIKPSNLMLTDEGRVKILDLGLVRFDLAEAGANGSRNFDIAGTLKFVAPEQVLGGPPCDARADLFSLGSTFYFLMTGRAPIEVAGAETLPARASQHATVPHTPIEELRRDVPANVAAVLNRCLEKRPDDRFRSAAEVAAALAPLSGEGILKRYVSTGTVSAKPEKRPRVDTAEFAAWEWRFVIAGVGSLIVAVGVWLAWFNYDHQTPLTTTAGTSSPARKHSDKVGDYRARSGPAGRDKAEPAGQRVVDDEDVRPEDLPRRGPNPLRFGVPARPPAPGAALTTADMAIQRLTPSTLPGELPQPRRGRTLLTEAPYQIEGVDAVNLDIVPASIFDSRRGFTPMVWSPDGRWFYTLDGQGGIYAVDGESLEEIARLETGAEFAGIALSKEGLVVGLRGLHALWVLDTATLVVKRQIAVDNMRAVAAAPATSIGYTVGADGLHVVDLREGRLLHFINGMDMPGAGERKDQSVSGTFQSMQATVDGRYLFAANLWGGLHRLRIEHDRLIYEESAGDVFFGFLSDVCVSRDGKWVALPTDNGSRVVGGGVAVFDGRDLRLPVLSPQRSDSSTALDFDPRTGNIYSVEKYCVDVFGPRGGWLKRLPWRYRSPLYLAVHPGGERVAVWSREKIVMLDFRPGRLAIDLADSLQHLKPPKE